MNQLQSVWSKFKPINDAISQRNSPTRELLDAVDGLKSLGFDHVRMKSVEAMVAHRDHLDSLGLGWRLQEVWNSLIKIEVLPDPASGKLTDKIIYSRFYKFWLQAVDLLLKSATYTFDDQKYKAYLDERDKADSGEKPLTGAARYDHVVIDEFQDINPLDLNLIKSIAERHRATITIVGDDDQAIYEWRGTTPEYIVNPDPWFGRTFETHTLGINYRSPANIVRLSQRLIENNTHRVIKTVQASRGDDAIIELLPTATINDSLDHVCDLIEQFKKKGLGPNQIALIGRKRAQLIPYQVHFAANDIPFCAAEDLQIFLSKTFDKLLELLEIKQKADTRQRPRQVAEDLLNLCNLAKRFPIKKADREQLSQHLSDGPRKLVEAVDRLAAYRGPLKGANSDGSMSQDFAASVQSFLDADGVSKTLAALGTEFAGLAADFGKSEEDIFYKDPPFAQLAEYAERYGDDYDQFLDDIERAKEQLAHVPPTDEDAGDTINVQRRPIHLMTALRAKGKEFDTTMLLDCVEDIWPSKYAITDQQLEAERRVFYVAFTRAKRRVIFQVAKRIGNRSSSTSRYIGEIGITAD